MYKTSELAIETDMREPDKIYIHPNDGYDLKLYSLSYNVKVFINQEEENINDDNEDCMDCEIILSNDQTPGKVKVQTKVWEKMGKPHKVTLYYGDRKLLIKNS